MSLLIIFHNVYLSFVWNHLFKSSMGFGLIFIRQYLINVWIDYNYISSIIDNSIWSQTCLSCPGPYCVYQIHTKSFSHPNLHHSPPGCVQVIWSKNGMVLIAEIHNGPLWQLTDEVLADCLPTTVQGPTAVCSEDLCQNYSSVIRGD